MNKQNVKIWEAEGTLYAEWADRSLDDDDRYSDTSIILAVSVPVEQGEKKLMAEMARAYDQWIYRTRN